MDHTNLEFTRTIKASPAHVYKCLTDPSARQVWNSPSEDAVFRVTTSMPVAAGNRETGQVGPADNPYVTAHTDWVICDSAVQLVYAETLEAEGMVLTTSLASAVLAEDGPNTLMTLHVHIVSFTGEESIKEVTEGWTFAFDAVTDYAATTA